jgi:hypothetical protein
MSAKHRWISASMAVGSLLLLSRLRAEKLRDLAPIPIEQLEVLGVQTPIKSVHFRDRDGEGLLVLSRSDGQASDPESEQEVDKVVLKATLYRAHGRKRCIQGALADRAETVPGAGPGRGLLYG